MFVVLHRMIHTRDIQVLCLTSWDFEVESLERSYLGNELQKKRKNPRSNSRLAISPSPFMPVLRSRQVVTELAGIKIRCLGNKFFAPEALDIAEPQTG